MEIDFGCILNDTEATRYMTIVNNSPLEVKYRWSFMLDNDTVTVFKKPVAFEDSSVEHEVGKLDEQMSEKLGDNEQFEEAGVVEQLDVTIEAGSSDSEVEMEEKNHQVCLKIYTLCIFRRKNLMIFHIIHFIANHANNIF